MEFYCKAFKGQDITPSLLQDIVILEKQFLQLPEEQIVDAITNRDLVYAFFTKKTNYLIGTIAIKWLFFEDCVVVYVANAAVKPAYQHHNLISHVILPVYLKTIFKYPFKKFFGAAIMATPKGYNLTKRFSNYFPSRTAALTPKRIRLMRAVANWLVGKGNYEEHDHVILINKYRTPGFCCEKNTEKVFSYDGYFEEVNPDYKNGKQLLIMFQSDLSSFYQGFKSTFRFYWKKVFS